MPEIAVISHDLIRLFVEGNPYPTNNKAGLIASKKGVQAHVYKAQLTRAWMQAITSVVTPFADTAQRISHNGFGLDLEFFLEPPNGAEGGAPVVAKPDDDNLKKPVQDALKQAKWFADDCLCFGSSQAKFYTYPGDPIGVRITLLSRMRTITKYLPLPAGAL